MSKVNRETAEKEINGWLDFKKVSATKRESNKDFINNLIDAVCEGVLVVKDDTKTIVHNLKFPTEGEAPLTTLEYKPRINYSSVKNHLTNVKPGDSDGRFTAYMAALTGQPKQLFEKLDTEDYTIAQSISLFFI
jgi:hypothetical protein